MKRQTAINRIRDRFSLLQTTLRAGSALNQTDLNRISEDVICPVLKMAFDLPALRNLNAEERENFPGIDLGDPVQGIGVQVTVKADAKKLRKTVRTCVQHQVYKNFPHLLVFVLTEKQTRYRVSFESEAEGLLEFTPARDVLDYRSVLEKVAHWPVPKLRALLEVLEDEVGSPGAAEIGPQSVDWEAVYLNLLPVGIPDTLYIGDLIPEARGGGGRSRFSGRRAVKEYMKDIGVRFASDWTVHESHILTFHELSDSSLPLSSMVDAGTITPFNPKEYYGISDGYLGAFKSLLRLCLQQKLFHRGVRWQHNQHLFLFSEGEPGELVRKETWEGEVTAHRRVFERIPKRSNPEETYQCKHLAFHSSFHLISGDWFLAVKPEWFFSFDGYRKHYFAPEKVNYLKRNERNRSVFNHLRFLTFFLRFDPPPDLFRGFNPYPFLKFGGLVSLSGPAGIDDAAWRLGEEVSEKSQLHDPEDPLPLFSQNNEPSNPS